RLVPAAHVHAPLLRFRHAVAPLLAARIEAGTIPAAKAIARSKPVPLSHERYVVVETFGSPFSPLNDTELQLALVRALALPTVLVSPSAVGAIGRVLQCLRALQTEQIEPQAIVLLGQPDPFAEGQIGRH